MITIHHSGYCARILPECGMNTYSLTWQGKELLRKAPDMKSYLSDPCIYGIPALLPPNRTKDGEFCFEGKTYQLGINQIKEHNYLHGTLHQQNFTITEQTESRVCGCFENHVEIFPFPFRIRICLETDENGYHMRYSILNIGDRNFPLSFALHANFVQPEVFRVPLGKRWERDERSLPTGILSQPDEREQAWIRGCRAEGSIGGFFTSAGSEAALDKLSWKVSENFNQWILWNMGGGHGFLSIEPQCGAVNCLQSGIGLKILPKGEEITFTAQLQMTP